MFVLCCKDYEYGLDYYKQYFYICLNKDGKNFGLYKIVEVGKVLVDFVDEFQWILLIMLRIEVMLEGFSLFCDWLVVEECSEGLMYLW